MKGRLRRGYSALIVGQCPIYARPKIFIGRAVSCFGKHDVRKPAVFIVGVST